jgi:hypothetical protein
MTDTALPPVTSPVRVRDTRDLLSVVPYLLGYRPAECVVVVCVRPGGGLGLVARTDLSDLRRPAHRTEVADLVARRAAEDGTVAAWVVVYTDGGTGPGSAARAAADAFAAALDAVVPERESWAVGADRYRSLDCIDPLCCAPEGYPVDGLESTAPGAELVLSGRAPLPTRDALYRVPRAEQTRRDLAGRAANRWDLARVAAEESGRQEVASWRSRAYTDWLSAARTASVDGTVSPALLGRLSVALDDRHVRDAVLLWATPGGAGCAAAVARGDDDGANDRAVAAAMAAVVDVDAASRPDEELMRTCVTVLEDVVAHAQRRRTAPPLTLLAFLAWWSGEGARAGYRCAEAQAVDPGYRLAGLVAAALDAGLPPGWVRVRRIGGSGASSGADLG